MTELNNTYDKNIKRGDKVRVFDVNIDEWLGATALGEPSYNAPHTTNLCVPIKLDREITNNIDIKAQIDNNGILWWWTNNVMKVEIDDEPEQTNTQLCPECSISMEWISMALKCPKCWKTV